MLREKNRQSAAGKRQKGKLHDFGCCKQITKSWNTLQLMRVFPVSLPFTRLAGASLTGQAGGQSLEKTVIKFSLLKIDT
jgi:hypothetical protein